MLILKVHWILLTISFSISDKQSSLAARLETIISDCYNVDNRSLCGICGKTDRRYVNELPHTCIYPFTYRFEVKRTGDNCNPNRDEGFCKDIERHCKDDSCLNGGTCHEGFGVYRCHCTDNHYGMRCEHTREKNRRYAAGIQVFISQTVKFDTNATLLVSTDVSGSDLLIKLESEISNLDYAGSPDPVIKNKNYISGEMRKTYCMELTGLPEKQCSFIMNATSDIYTMTYNFPVINEHINKERISHLDPPTPGIMIYKGRLFPPPKSKDRLGYVAQITVTAYQAKNPTGEDLPYVERDHLPVFQNTYPIFVSYNDQTWCIACPKVLSSNCVRDPRKRPVFSPSHSFKIDYDFINTFEPIENVRNLQWESDCFIMTRYEDIMRMVIDFEFILRSVVPNNNENEHKYFSYNKLVGKRRTFEKVEYPMYTFESGIISLEIGGYVSFPDHPTSVIEELNRTSGFTPRNYARCYFEIRRELLSPFINLGINQSYYVNTEDGLTIDASRSINPNKKNKTDMFFKWSCKLGITNEPCFSDKVFDDTSNIINFGPNMLLVNKIYNFSLRLYEEKYRRTTNYAFIAVDVGSNKGYVLRLKCLNCWSGIIAMHNDYNILLLSHEGNLYNIENYQYKWFYKEINENDYKPADAIRADHTDKYIFKIEKYALENSKTYEFYVSMEGATPKVNTTINLKLMAKHILGCDIRPTTGVRGVTLFEISCDVYPQDGITYVYEFFDKGKSDEQLFSGRMLGSSTSGDLFTFRLTRGRVSVVSFDTRKVVEEYTLDVTLEPFNETVNYIEDLINIFKTESDIGIPHLKYSESDIALPSAIGDILTNNMERHYLIKDLIDILAQSQILYISEIKLGLSSIRNILLSMSENLKKFDISAEVGKQCADLLLKITTNLVYKVYHSELEKTLNELICQQLSRYVLETVSVVLRYKNKEVLNNIEEYVDPKVLSLVQLTSHEMVDSLEKISLMLLWLRTPGDSPSKITTSDITSWVKTGIPGDVQRATEREEQFSLHISKELSGAMRHYYYIGVHVMRMYINPYWWSGDKIVRSVLFAVLCDKKDNMMDCKTVKSLPYPIRLYYDIETLVNSIEPIVGEAKPLAKAMNDEEKDLSLTVYRFIPPVRAKLTVQFFFDENDLRQYKVLFKKNVRPDCEDVREDALLIDKKNTIYNVTYDKNDDDNIYYMGIVPIGSASLLNEIFKLRIYYAQCKTWLIWQWSHRGCWVGKKTSDSILECECLHLSMFTGTILTPLHDKFPFLDFQLYLSSQSNFLPLITLIILIIIYIISFICCALRDKDDRKRRNIIILDDNYPNEKYAYLIAIYTGHRVRSGTRANVGIKIIGSENDSRPHILKSSKRRTLRTNSDDWFLMFCPAYLGTISVLHIWHDNSSCQSDWFLDKVKVYDLTRRLAFVFYANEWIAFKPGMFPEVLMFPVGLRDCFKTTRLLNENLIAGLRDSHYWGSLWWKHPRDPNSRVYRLQVVFCFATTAMAVSLLLYLAKYTFPSDEDHPSYELTSFDFWALLISSLTASAISTCTMFLLSNSFQLVPKRNPSLLVLRRDEMASSENIFAKNQDNSAELLFLGTVRGNAKLNDEKSKQNENFGADLERYDTIEGWKAALYRIVRRTQLVPVSTKNVKYGVIVRKSFLFFAWGICALSIAICCFVVFTYSWCLEPVHGYEWLTILIGAIVLDILVLQILKVFISSVLLSLIFARTMPVEEFVFDFDDDINDTIIRDLDTIIERRSNRIYLPLSHTTKDLHLKKLYRRLRWEMVFLFVVLAMFLLGMIVSSDTFSRAEYANNRQATAVISRGHVTSRPQDYREVSDRTALESFLQHNFVAQAYRFLWYNLSPLSDAGGPRLDWTDDYVSRVVGHAYLRQLRASRSACPAPAVLPPDAVCLEPWSERSQDRGSYYPGWRLRADDDSLTSTAPWTYAPPDGFTSSRYFGASGALYPAGGYFAHLGYRRRETRHVLASLSRDSWLDAATRAVFLQITLYNVNADLFSHVVLISEQPPFGGLLTRVRTESVSVHSTFDFWDASFAVFLVAMTARALLLVNQHGVSGFFSNRLYRLEALMIFLGYLTVIAYVFHLNAANRYASEYHKRGLSEFFSFIQISKHKNVYETTAFVLYFCLVLRLLCSLRFGRIFLRFFHTIWMPIRFLICLSIYFFIGLGVLWRLIGYSIQAFQFVYETCLAIGLHPNILNVHDKTVQIPLASKIFLMAIGLLSTTVTTVTMILFTHFYKVAQGHKVADVYNYNFVEFLRDEFKGIIGPKSVDKR